MCKSGGALVCPLQFTPTPLTLTFKHYETSWLLFFRHMLSWRLRVSPPIWSGQKQSLSFYISFRKKENLTGKTSNWCLSRQGWDVSFVAWWQRIDARRAGLYIPFQIIFLSHVKPFRIPKPSPNGLMEFCSPITSQGLAVSEDYWFSFFFIVLFVLFETLRRMWSLPSAVLHNALIYCNSPFFLFFFLSLYWAKSVYKKSPQ